MSAFPPANPAMILVPYWLAADQREQLAESVRASVTGRLVHPVAAIHLEDVLTELHVAAARDGVWPAPAARVRRATGWDDDVLPVRLSAAELASVLAVPGLPDAVRVAARRGSGQLMQSRFGGSSAGLLQRLRPARIDVADLRDVAAAVLPALATPRLRVGVVQRSGAGSLLVLEEDERRVRVQLGELADDMSRAGVLPTPDGMAAALAAWVDTAR